MFKQTILGASIAATLAFGLPADSHAKNPNFINHTEIAASQTSLNPIYNLFNSDLLWEGKIFTDITGKQVQYAGLKNGIIARMSFNKKTGVFHIGATNGIKYDININSISANTVEQEKYEAELRMKRPNGCQVATGIMGLAHTALWSGAAGAAFGGLAGVAVGTIYGAFWWAVGTQC